VLHHGLVAPAQALRFLWGDLLETELLLDDLNLLGIDLLGVLLLLAAVEQAVI
jgi:hypothetical protein